MNRNFNCGRAVLTAMSLVLAAATSVAHANSFLCFTEGQSSGDGQGYEIACGNGQAYYADLTVTPTSDDGGDIAIHISDHFDCSGDTHMECSMSSDLRNNICMPEGEFNTSYKGDVPQLFLQCSCYSPDDPCETVE